MFIYTYTPKTMSFNTTLLEKECLRQLEGFLNETLENRIKIIFEQKKYTTPTNHLCIQTDFSITPPITYNAAASGLVQSWKRGVLLYIQDACERTTVKQMKAIKIEADVTIFNIINSASTITHSHNIVLKMVVTFVE